MKNGFTYWTFLLKQYLKRDWKLLTVWLLGMGSFAGGFVLPFQEIGKENGLAALYEVLQNPAMIGMCGPTPVTAAADCTLGSMYAHMMTLLCGLIAMLISAVFVVAHTRYEEEKGLSEYVCAFSVGRHANQMALFVEILLLHGGLALFSGILMAVCKEESMPLGGCLLFGFSVGLAGFMGAVIAMLFAQLMPTGTGATGTSLMMIGLLYMLRAGSDASGGDFTWLNPMGWTYQTFPFVENNLLPLAVGAVFCLVIFACTLLLEKNRDMGAGYVPERTGRRKVRKSLLSVPGLFFGLNKGILLGWIATFVVLASMYGSIYGDMEAFLDSNDMIRAMFLMQGISIDQSFTATLLVVLMGLVAILPVVVMNKLFAEEQQGHMSQLFATKVTRGRIYFANVLVALGGTAAAAVLATLGLGGVGSSVMENCSMKLKDFLYAGLNYFPAIFVFLGIASAIIGWKPGLRKLSYVYIGYSIALNYFRGILNLPDWLNKTAILSWIPRMPAEEFDGKVFAGLMVVGVALILLGYVGYRSRNLVEEG